MFCISPCALPARLLPTPECPSYHADGGGIAVPWRESDFITAGAKMSATIARQMRKKEDDDAKNDQQQFVSAG